MALPWEVRGGGDVALPWGFYFPCSDHSFLVLLHILPLLSWDPRTYPRWNHPDPPNVLELPSAASFRATAGCR